MNAPGIFFTLIVAFLIFILPRRWAALPLLAGTCYVTIGQVIQLGPFHFTVIRILVACGFMRVLIRGEFLHFKLNFLDFLMCLFLLWCLLSSFFHKDISEAFVYRLGISYSYVGIFFLFRFFIKSIEDIKLLCRLIAVILAPIAIAMIFEKMTRHNLFASFGAVSELSAIRLDHIRSQGPFRHPILAGSVGAVCLPLMIGLWRINSKLAALGILACVAMIITSTSSGPILSGLISIGAMLLWSLRNRMNIVRWLGVIGYVALDLVMKAPAYYLIARIDAVGGSTGWHRARLIESSIEHLSEWWFAGTDYTRHWMPTGVSWSPDHTDITNHYLQMGVIGGLPLMLLFIATIFAGFTLIGRWLKNSTELSVESKFLSWSLGASLFAHAVTCISVSYFDQSFVFLYMTFAAIGSLNMQRENALNSKSKNMSQRAKMRLNNIDGAKDRSIEPLRVTKRVI